MRHEFRNGGIAFDKFYPDRRATEPEMVSTEAEKGPTVSEEVKTKKTIAVLPFTDLSPDKDQEYFVDGLSEEIINSLAQIQDLTVIGRTSSFTFKGSNKKIQEIANELGVENILEGSVRKAGNELRITAQLLRAADGSHLWSKNYDRELKDIFTVQEDIATTVANELKITLGISKSLSQLGGTDNVEAYELYLVAQGQLNEGNYIERTRALESINTALALDPEFTLAWVSKGSIHLALAANSPSPGLIAPEYDAALQASLRAIELEPNLAEAYELLGDYRSAKGDWIEAELAFRKATELTTTPLYTIPGALHLISVGHLKKFHEYVEAARLNDPFNSGIRAFYIVSLGIQGNMHLAKQEDARCKALFGDQWNDQNWGITFIRLGANDAISSDEILYSEPIFDAAKKYLDSPEDGLAELRRIYSNQDNLNNYNLVNISAWVAYFSDDEFAMDAQEKAFSLDAGRIWTVWYPVMREVRKLPRFKGFVKKIGLVDYWNKFGWPDICRQLDNGDFECD